MKIKLFLFIILLLTAVSCTAEDEPATLDMPPTPTLSPAVVTQQEESPATTGGAVSTPLPITPAVTASPIAATLPPPPPPVTGGLPASSHDLLFIADGSLKLWRHNPAQIETLMMGDMAFSNENQNPGQRIYDPVVGDVASLAVSADGSRAVVAKLVSKTPFIPDPAQAYTDTIGTYQLILIDLNSGVQQVMMSAVHNRFAPPLSLSQNGRYLVVSGAGIGDVSDIVMEDGQLAGTLYLRETAVGAITQPIDRCLEMCVGMVWHNDGNLFVYGNQDGLKMYNLSADAPELLVDGSVTDEFPWGKHFTPISWANNGRSLLTWYSSGIEGGERAVFDMPTKNVMAVPNSLAYAGPYAHMEWMYDARLFVVRQNESQQAIGETFRVDGDNNQIILDETVALSADASYPLAPMHWENGRFAYALFNVNSDFGQASGNSSGLYQRISFNEDAERLNDAPSLTDFFIVSAWEKETGNSLVLSDRGTMWVMPTNGTAIMNMETAVGDNAHSFNWLN